MIESLLWCHFHILVGIFHYIPWLVYSNAGLPQIALGLREQALVAHPLSFFLSFHKLIALVHPLHGNPYSLTLISIDGHLHSPLIRPVDVRLSSPFLSSQPPTLYHHSAMSMACAYVLRKSWKSWSALKSIKQLLGSSSGLCMMGVFCVMKMKHGLTIWFCRDKLSLAMLFW